MLPEAINGYKGWLLLVVVKTYLASDCDFKNGKITLNFIIVYRLLVLDGNTWNHI